MKQKIKDEVLLTEYDPYYLANAEMTEWDGLTFEELHKFLDLAISKTAKAIFEELSRFWVGGIDENGEPVKGKREFYDFDFEELRKKWCEE